ncbi:MAG: DUF4294 domain-containing protein [Rikenellaceae bacterium]|nr:DUF4294 domain-containing protein [Rikenellaceae bacterium]
MKKKFSHISLLTFILAITGMTAGAQILIEPPPLDKNPEYNVRSYYLTETTVVDGDTIPLIRFKPIYVFPKKMDLRRYERMIKNLKIVYPIAKYANQTLREIEAHLETLETQKEKDKYVKDMEKELKKAFTPVLKNMTFSQGKILIKLIDRETGQTSYELVKELRGGFSAFLYQGIAKLFGANLKDTYDKDGEDKILEKLILLYESGQL